MKKKFPVNYSLYETVYSDEYPFEQYYIITFDKIPSKYSSQLSYNDRIFEFALKSGYLCDCKVTRTNRRGEITTNKIFINNSKRSFLKIIQVYDKKEIYYKLEVLYDMGSITLEDLFDWEKLKELETVKKKSNINLVKNEMGHLDVEEYDLPIPEVDVELNYGKSFLKIHNTIIEKLNNPLDKGIILLHGDPGSGKTTYIKYITSLIKNKEILFIPPSMAEVLSEPSMIPFLMEHKNSILIIEDSERVISDRETTGSPTGVSNILNLTDGILGDCLGIQIIATFNMKREKIDQALLRKGRLIAEHKFDKLTVDETNNLLKHLGKDYVVKEGMVLSDIYNIDVEEIKSQKPQKIGFNR
jgi:ATP-dependent 26S proteasome regulatory subunit